MFGLMGVARMSGQPNAFSPLSLFRNSEQGVWYDPSDFSTMFQDSAGTTPVTAVEQPVGRINDKSGNGNHATQPTAAARPVVSAPHYMTIDGVDDRLDLSSLSLIAGMDCFVAVNTNTDIPTQALFARDAGYSAFFGVWASGGGSATYGGAVGTPDLAVDGTLLPAATRDDLSSALTVGDWHIIEYRNLDLSTWTTMRLFGGGLPFSGDIGGLVLCPSQDAATRTKVRQWLGNKVGVTL